MSIIISVPDSGPNLSCLFLLLLLQNKRQHRRTRPVNFPPLICRVVKLQMQWSKHQMSTTDRILHSIEKNGENRCSRIRDIFYSMDKNLASTLPTIQVQPLTVGWRPHRDTVFSFLQYVFATGNNIHTFFLFLKIEKNFSIRHFCNIMRTSLSLGCAWNQKLPLPPAAPVGTAKSESFTARHSCARKLRGKYISNTARWDVLNLVSPGRLVCIFI